MGRPSAASRIHSRTGKFSRSLSAITRRASAAAALRRSLWLSASSVSASSCSARHVRSMAPEIMPRRTFHVIGSDKTSLSGSHDTIGTGDGSVRGSGSPGRSFSGVGGCTVVPLSHMGSGLMAQVVAEPEVPPRSAWIFAPLLTIKLRQVTQKLSESTDLLGIGHVGSTGASETAADCVFCFPQFLVCSNEFGAGVRRALFAELPCGDARILDPEEVLLSLPPGESGAFPGRTNRFTVQPVFELGAVLLPLPGLIGRNPVSGQFPTPYRSVQTDCEDRGACSPLQGRVS